MVGQASGPHNSVTFHGGGMKMSGASLSPTRLGLPEAAAVPQLVSAGSTDKSMETVAGNESVGAPSAAMDITSRVTPSSPTGPQSDRAADGPSSERATSVPGKSIKERLRLPLMVVLPILVAILGAVYYLAEQRYVSTTDAFVRAAKVTLNARVSGQVVEIAVRDNQRVRQGQVLVRIDPEPYQTAVAQAEARPPPPRL